MSATGHRPPPPPRSGPAPCAAGPRPRAGPGLRSSIKIRRADGRGPSRSPTAVRRSKRGAKPGPLSTTDVLTGRALTRSIRGRRRQDASSGPGAAVDAIPPPRAGHGTSTGGSEPTGHGAVRRAEPGASTLPPARAPTGRTTRPPSRPEKQPCGAPPRLPATATDTDAEHRVPGRLRELARHPSQLPRPPPASPSGGAPTRPVGASARRPAADAQKDDPVDYRSQLNPASITRRTGELQDVLTRPEDKTDRHPPRPDPQHPARRPQGHPGQESLPPSRPRSRGQSHVRHRRSFAGTLT